MLHSGSLCFQNIIIHIGVNDLLVNAIVWICNAIKSTLNPQVLQHNYLKHACMFSMITLRKLTFPNYKTIFFLLMYIVNIELNILEKSSASPFYSRHLMLLLLVLIKYVVPNIRFTPFYKPSTVMLLLIQI